VNPRNNGERKRPDDHGMSEKALLDNRKSLNQFIRERRAVRRAAFYRPDHP
jgi:hypothetical protein